MVSLSGEDPIFQKVVMNNIPMAHKSEKNRDDVVSEITSTN